MGAPSPTLTDTFDDPGDSPEDQASPRPRRAGRGLRGGAALTFAAAAVAGAALLAPRVGVLAVAAAPTSPAPTVARLFAKFAPAEAAAPPPPEPPAPPPAFARLTGKPATPLPREAPATETPPAEAAPRLSEAWKKAIYGATGLFAALFLGGYVLFMPKKPSPPPDEVKHPRVLNIQSPEPVRVAPPAPPAPAVPPSPAEVKASRKELLARVRVVLEKGGCDVDKARKAGKNMVFAAAESGNVEALKMLVAAGADVNAPATSGETPANAAARKGHVAAREYLLARGAVAKTPTKAKKKFF